MQETSKTFSLRELFTHVKPAMNLVKLLSLGFGIILITWLVSQLELSETLKILREVPISFLIIGFLCYALSFYLRTVRFRVLLSQNKSVKHLFPIVLVHYTALNIIPARLGELSYVYLLKKVNHVSAGCSISTLIMARVFDQIAISTLFLISSRFVNLQAQWMETLKLTIEGFLVVIFVGVIFILMYKEKFAELLKKLISRFRWDNYKIIQRIMRQMEDIVVALKEIQVKRKAIRILGLSATIWICIFNINYVLLKAFDVHLSYAEIVWASTLIILSVLPVPSLNFAGFREITWTGIALALGVPKNVAIVSAFGTHILSTLFLCVFGVYGFWGLRRALSSESKNIEAQKQQTC
ncbi:MAG: flippase-like domain-containing protein [Deltaproteobacteria bacterium]|nr:flippase-like domain-containing protein [Deltaproteobacteria bacterium]